MVPLSLAFFRIPLGRGAAAEGGGECRGLVIIAVPGVCGSESQDERRTPWKSRQGLGELSIQSAGNATCYDIISEVTRRAIERSFSPLESSLYKV